jgi:hypothetical protein
VWSVGGMTPTGKTPKYLESYLSECHFMYHKFHMEYGRLVFKITRHDSSWLQFASSFLVYGSVHRIAIWGISKQLDVTFSSFFALFLQLYTSKHSFVKPTATSAAN